MKILLLTIHSLLVFNVLFSQAPANDDCAGAIHLGTAPVAAGTVFTTIEATSSAQTAPSCFWNSAVQNDVWFTFTTGSAADYCVSMTGVSPQVLHTPMAAVYEGAACGSLVEVACSAAYTSDNRLNLNLFGLAPNTTYFLRVDNFPSCGLPDEGTFTVGIGSPCVPAGAVTLTMQPPSTTTTFGSTVAIDVQVSDFASIAGMQYSIGWDEAVLHFNSVSNFNLQDLSAANFGTNNAANGQLSLSWYNSTTGGVTVPNGTAIFTLNFTVTGLPGFSSPVAFGDVPTPKEVFDDQLALKNVVCQNAIVSIPSNGLTIIGNIHRCTNTPVESVNVALTGSQSSNWTTDATGNYFFDNLTSGGNYTVTPMKDINPLEGVTTLDLILISRHILGVQPLSSPYDLIAADANKSGSVTTFDIVETRKLILGINQSFPSNTSWRFVPENFVFPNPANPFQTPFPESEILLNLTASTLVNFVGMKTGDVTGCGNPTSAPFLTLTAPHETVNPGAQVVLDVTADNFANVAGLQFSMSWDDAIVQFQAVQGLNLPGLTAANFNTSLPGGLAFSWNEPNLNGITLPGGTVIFQLVFTAIGSAGQSTPVAFTQSPAIFEVTDGLLNTSSLNHSDGSVTIAGGGGGGLTFSATTVTSLPVGSTFCIDVSVEDFQSIASMQFSMNFDPALIQFSHFQNFNLPNLSAANFGTGGAGLGQLTVVWFDPNAVGVTLPDGTEIFSACFTALACGNSPFNFTNSPIPIEIVNASGQLVPPTFNNGGAEISVNCNNCQDLLPPVITCPPAFIGECSQNMTGSPTATDDCDNSLTINYSDNTLQFCTPTYDQVFERTWTATDDAGHSASCVQTISVFPPDLVLFSFPPDISVSCETGANPANTGDILYDGQPFTGNCVVGIGIEDDTLFTNICPFPLKIFRTWTVTSWCIYDPATGAGLLTHVQIIQLEDTSPPVILNCSANLQVASLTGECGATVVWAQPIVADDCGSGSTTLVSSHLPGSFFPIGSTMVIYVATDACGGMASCSFLVTVVDTEFPDLACPADITQNTDPGECSAAVFWAEPTVTDNCPGVISMSNFMPGNTFPLGSTLVEYVAQDVNGNLATCSFSITIEDHEPPVALCVGALTVSLPASGMATLPAADFDDGSFDNCHPVEFSTSRDGGSFAADVPFDCNDLGQPVQVTLRVTDAATGDFSDCLNFVTVEDPLPPTITCPAADTLACVDNLPTDFSAFGQPVISDNCLVVNLSENISSIVSGDLALVTRTFTAADLSGNSAVCSQLVTVFLNPPVQPHVLEQCDDGDGSRPFPLYLAIPIVDVAGGHTVSFHASQAEANAGVNALPLTFETPETIVFARVSNQFGCFKTAAVSLDVVTCTVDNHYLADPCGCRQNPALPGQNGNATSLQNGQFTDTIFVDAPAGESWSVVSLDGFFQPGSAQPPVAPIAGLPGASLLEIAPGEYVLPGVSVDSVGFELVVINNWGVSLTLLRTTCFYPTPTVTPLDDLCFNGDPVLLTGSEVNGASGDATFRLYQGQFALLDTSPGTSYTFDPSAYPLGFYTIEFAFDAGAAQPGSLTNPGCEVRLPQTFEIDDPPAPICNDLEQVSLDENCLAEVTPDDILEGTYNYNLFTVSVFNHAGQPIGNVVNETHRGQTLTVKVTDDCDGNSCWGQILVEDKLPPVIFCASPIVISCWENLDSVPPPLAFDACDTTIILSRADLLYLDELVCPDGKAVVARKWIATDGSGNISAPCFDTVFIVRPAQVDFPDDVNWTCQQFAAHPNIIEATPLTDSLHTTGSGDLSYLEQVYCNFGVNFSDEIFETCGGSFKIVRTWSVFDWCAGQVVNGNSQGEDNQQVIKILDVAPPVVSVPDFSLPANLPGEHPTVCRSTGLLLPPVVSDDCSQWSVKIFTPIGEAIYANGVDGKQGGHVPLPGLALGAHLIKYVVADECGNKTILEKQVQVVDIQVPIAICDEITEITLTSTGTAELFANVLDDGSYDNCCLDHFSVRKMADACDDGHDDLQFGESVIFCCKEAGTTVTVVMRAHDCHGNFNECMVQLQVGEKLPPLLTSCPANQRITCDWSAANLEAALFAIENDPALTAAQRDAAQDVLLAQHFGSPNFTDNCSPVVTPQVTLNLDQCLEGRIIRTWTAKDAAGNAAPQSCVQTIFVDHVSDFVVQFPADLTVNCGTEPPAFGEPKVFFETCELAAVSFEDELFTVVADACFKILRTWTVINWCVVGAEIDQEVVESSERAFQLAFPGEPCDFDGDGDCDLQTYRDSWRTNPKSKPGASIAIQTTNPDTDPDSDPWDGFITHKQTVKVQDTVDPVFVGSCAIPDVCIEGTTCSASLILPTPTVQECSPQVTLAAEIDLGAGWTSLGQNGFGAYPNVPPGTYPVRFTAVDNCNNQAKCEATVKVKDCKPPTPYCKAGIVVELSTTDPPQVTVWAADLNDNSFDNCPGDLKFSFSPQAGDNFKVYDCDDFGANEDTLWVSDAAGNQDFCTTVVQIQANQMQCEDQPQVAGNIKTPENKGVAGVAVSVNSAGGFAGQAVSAATGHFDFGALPPGDDYTLTPLKDSHPLDGVTTFDLVLISKHILGVQPLGSPYKLICADANRSGSVTTFDLVQLRKLILFMDDELPNNTSWRFVAADYVFPVPENPWAEPFPEGLNLNNLAGPVLNGNFVACKIGDVNGSASGD